jgi:peptidoglycan/LPS O-acetylase OafA/YrhL
MLSGRWFSMGQLGVALFFLISGFVIPFSLERYSRSGFLLARLLRIYPVYAAAVALDVAVLASSAAYWGVPFHLSPGSVLANLLLINNLVGVPTLDMINWTLAVEMKFYLLVALLYQPIRTGRMGGLCCVAVLLAVCGADLVYIVFMGIGTAFKFHHDGRLSMRSLIAGAGGLFTLFLAAMFFRMGKAMFGNFVTYGYALGLFGLAYLLRHKARPIAVLDRLADVSFPLYAIHTLLGYSLLKLLMMGLGWSYLPALALTAAVLGIAAFGLHLAVERPTIALGHRLRDAG